MCFIYGKVSLRGCLEREREDLYWGIDCFLKGLDLLGWEIEYNIIIHADWISSIWKCRRRCMPPNLSGYFCFNMRDVI